MPPAGDHDNHLETRKSDEISVVVPSVGGYGSPGDKVKDLKKRLGEQK